MNHPLAVHADVGVLEGGNPLSASATYRKQRERIARELVEDRVVVSP
jgi:hypothetical protein